MGAAPPLPSVFHLGDEKKHLGTWHCERQEQWKDFEPLNSFIHIHLGFHGKASKLPSFCENTSKFAFLGTLCEKVGWHMNFKA